MFVHLTREDLHGLPVVCAVELDRRAENPR
jgi:hypothetical protein